MSTRNNYHTVKQHIEWLRRIQTHADSCLNAFDDNVKLTDHVVTHNCYYKELKVKTKLALGFLEGLLYNPCKDFEIMFTVGRGSHAVKAKDIANWLPSHENARHWSPCQFKVIDFNSEIAKCDSFKMHMKTDPEDGKAKESQIGRVVHQIEVTTPYKLAYKEPTYTVRTSLYKKAVQFGRYLYSSSMLPAMIAWCANNNQRYTTFPMSPKKFNEVCLIQKQIGNHWTDSRFVAELANPPSAVWRVEGLNQLRHIDNMLRAVPFTKEESAYDLWDEKANCADVISKTEKIIKGLARGANRDEEDRDSVSLHTALAGQTRKHPCEHLVKLIMGLHVSTDLEKLRTACRNVLTDQKNAVLKVQSYLGQQVYVAKNHQGKYRVIRRFADKADTQDGRVYSYLWQEYPNRESLPESISGKMSVLDITRDGESGDYNTVDGLGQLQNGDDGRAETYILIGSDFDDPREEGKTESS
jgi:hypothetical protein